MYASVVQGWIGVFAAVVGVIVTVLGIFNYKSRRDRLAAIGASFKETVDALSSDSEVKCMANAVLLRRFFDPMSEQGVGLRRRTPYRKETIEVIASMLRKEQPAEIRKALANGLRYAVDLRASDLAECDLSGSYLGQKGGDPRSADLSNADLWGATCVGTSFRKVTAVETVFQAADLRKAVFIGANCLRANFREADCRGAKFRNADLGSADFAGATLARSESDDVSLKGADFSDANVQGATFDGVDLNGVVFTGARLGGARFVGALSIPEEVRRHVVDGVALSGAVAGEAASEAN